MRNGLAVRSEEQAKKVPKIFPTNEIARNKICSADLLNGHEWRKVRIRIKVESRPFQAVCYKGSRKKNDEPSDMVRILSEMEKCTSNINFDG
jgi:hypothetical protein